MGEAGYIAGRRYDAVKNAFLSYQTAERKPKKVRSRISRSGETFSAGRKILGKVCIVGGYIRLFLALDPKQYNADKYHHKDYSEVVRYAKFPFMIKLSSDRQVKYAQELIADVMRENGFETDRSYFPQDQAFIFKKPRRKAVAEAAEVSPQIVYLPYADEEAAASEDIGEPEAIDVKLPKRASVVDKQGNRIGKIRQSVWYDENEVEKGTFRKEETNVFLYEGATRTAYLDKNDNVLTTENKYVATIRRSSHRVLLIIFLILLIAALVTSIVCACLLSRSDNTDYAPVLFIATEDGAEWKDSENLPVFVNEGFGDATVAPGMRGAYRFIFENRNKDVLEFSLGFSETNEYGIGMRYRLKRDGAYVSGVGDYVPAAELGLENMTVEAQSSSVFELEWFWEHSDEADTAAGENGATYTLHISFSAWVRP